jgi:hypothetical protein
LRLRGSKFVVTLLLLISAILVSTPYLNIPQPVRAVPGTITLNPTFAGRGAIVSVSGTGFIFANGTTLGKGTASSVSCNFFTLDRLGNPGTLITSPICSVTGTNNDTFSGSFVVKGTLSPINNPYIFIVNMTDTGTSKHFIKAQATFTVTAIKITPSSGPFGSVISVNGSLAGSDTTCTMSGTPVSTYSCTISGSTGGNFSGNFIVASVAPGPYTVTVAGSPSGANVYTQFTVTSPNITLVPNKGGVGTYVSVIGRGFSFSDVTCSLSSSTSSSFPVSTACSIHTYPNGTRQPVANFNVGSVTAGTYILRLTGSAGDYAEATFNVTTGPVITLSPKKGIPGTFVTVTGSGFVGSDTSCTISGTPVTSSACTMTPGTGAIGAGQASFVVLTEPPGLYLITVVGTAGGVSDTATAVFNVTRPFFPTLAITPPDGPRGTIVKLTGTGFLASASSCQLTSTGAFGDPFLITSPSCSISSGTLTAQFTVGTSAKPVGPAWIHSAVNVTADTGDTASTTFLVDNFPTISVFKGASIVTGGFAGQFFTVNVTSGQFSSGDQGSCTLSSSPGGLFSSSNCVIQSSGKSLTGTNFIVSGTASGFYTITVTGSQGDSAFTSFTVNINGTLVLSTNNATTGTLITFRGTGFSISDTGACTVLSYIEAPGPKHTLSNLLITSPTCSISSQVATGSFIVGPSATTNVYWNVTVRGSPQNDQPAYAVFNVTASVTVSPSSGTIGSVFSFSGSGYSSLATSCMGSFHPSLGTLAITTNCGIVSPNSGEVAGSFIVPGSAVSGVYVLNVGDQKGHNASATFTIGTPTAQITIVPNSITPGQSFAISGSGFNGNDTYCKISTGFPILKTTATTCAVAGGFVSGAVTTDPTAVPGLYLITVNATNSMGKPLDFASNYIFVGGVTTVSTTTTLTTSTSTTPTSSTTTTATTVISTTLTTTTYSTTGISTQSFFQTTVTTVSGLTTTSVTSLTTTFQTSTATRTTTTTITTSGPILAAQKHVEVASPALPDSLGLLALLLIVVPMLFRRLFT